MVRKPKRPVPGRRVRSNMGDLSSGLQYALGQIDNQLVVVQQTLSEDRLSSAQYRTHVRESLEAGKERMGTIEHEVHNLGEKVDGVKATVDCMDRRVQVLEDQGLISQGAKRAYNVVGKLVYGAAGAIATAAGFLAEKFLDKGLPHP